MNTLLRIDAETLPRILVLDPPMSDTEFETLCHENDNVRFERTEEGAIRMHPPVGGWTSSGNFEINRQLGAWWITHERGKAFDSSGGFRLPDGLNVEPRCFLLDREMPQEIAQRALRRNQSESQGPMLSEKVR